MTRVARDAFDQYFALGASRTYETLAARLGCSKRSIVRHAKAERWQERLTRIEQEARTKADEKLAESLASVTERHLRTLRIVQHKALQSLASAPTGTAAQAAATLIAAVKAERNIVAPPDAQPGDHPLGSHAALAEAAGLIPTEVVQAGLEAMRKAMAAAKVAPIPAPLPALSVSHSLAWPGSN